MTDERKAIMMDDTRLTLLTFDHYRLSKPKMFKEMSADGTLWETIGEKVEACRSLIDGLMQQGMTDIEATAYAIETVINERG